MWVRIFYFQISKLLTFPYTGVRSYEKQYTYICINIYMYINIYIYMYVCVRMKSWHGNIFRFTGHWGEEPTPATGGQRACVVSPNNLSNTLARELKWLEVLVPVIRYALTLMWFSRISLDGTRCSGSNNTWKLPKQATTLHHIVHATIRVAFRSIILDYSNHTKETYWKGA